MTRRSALISLVAVLVVVFGALAATLAAGLSPKLGLDLQGGFSVILEAPEGTDQEVLEKSVEIIRRRIEALGNVQEPEIAVAGERNVVVQLPGVTDRDRALAAVGTTGQLEFRPVLDVSPLPGVSPLVVAAASAATTTTTTTAGDTTSTTAGGTTTTTTTVPEDIEIVLPEGISFCDYDRPLLEQPGCVDEERGVTVVSDPAKQAWMGALGPDGTPETGPVYHLAPAEVLGSDLDGAEARFQQTGGGQGPIGVGGGGLGQWVVLLDFNDEGTVKFQETTKTLAQYPYGDPRRQFAIVLDGQVQSAPSIAEDVSPDEGIGGGSAVITLGASEDQEAEARDLAVVLRYGALPVAFELPSVQQVSATLGSDSLTAGLIAGIGGLVLVAVAMILYYRSLGFINVIGLTVFGSIMLIAFSVLGEVQGVTLTLAGVTGIIVAVGITSDSYIVYFERIKEEVHEGRSLRAAIDHAFRRSFRTILTADFVSFLGAVLLFWLAIGSVRGFALALGIATVTDVFVAYFYTRPAVSLLAHTRFGEGGPMSIRGATGRASEQIPEEVRV
jgi:preprotein translocase subunit SecD